MEWNGGLGLYNNLRPHSWKWAGSEWMNVYYKDTIGVALGHEGPKGSDRLVSCSLTNNKEREQTTKLSEDP